MHVLVVEDDAVLADGLTRVLAGHGMLVDVVRNGSQADALLQRADASDVSVVVLDIGLPGIDGFEVVRRLRARGAGIPVLLLTARDAIEDRVRGLELGADDYLVKPFAFSELLARVRSLLRRGSSAPQETALQLADLRLDLIRRRVERDGQRIDLTAKEFALLELLLRRQGEVLPKSLIASQVWDMNFDSDTNIIEVAIRRLRLKVDDNFPNKLIHTVRGMGYVLEERCS